MVSQAELNAVTRYDPQVPPQIVVSASGISKDEITSAHYRCNGFDDSAQLQAAINEVLANGAGEIRLTRGNFNLTTKLTFTTTARARIVGAGSTATTLQR